MYHFCTYFDHNYLTRGLALYRSLVRYCASPFTLWVLCFDSEALDVMTRLNLPSVHLISQAEFEAGDEQLVNAKTNRSRVEYYWTCTPSLPLYILNRYPEVEMITYLDADLFFFADPAPLFQEMADHSIAIIAHRFPPARRYLEQNGIFNVGWLSFRRDTEARACLELWRAQCIEWCYARVEDGRFGDQKYLDDWIQRYSNLIVLQYKGANVGAWNIVNYQIRQIQSQIWVDNDPLIFFHFHGLTQIRSWLYAPNRYKNRIPPTVPILHGIYEPYIRELEATKQMTEGLFSIHRQENPTLIATQSHSVPWRRIKYAFELASQLLKREIVLYLNGRVI